MRLRPKPGLVVRDPAQPRVPLPAEGREVPDSAYWRRRLDRGDAELVDELAEQTERAARREE